VRTVPAEVRDVLLQDWPQVPWPGDQHPVGGPRPGRVPIQRPEEYAFTRGDGLLSVDVLVALVHLTHVTYGYFWHYGASRAAIAASGFRSCRCLGVRQDRTAAFTITTARPLQ
jgi:hypothetical protein